MSEYHHKIKETCFTLPCDSVNIHITGLCNYHCRFCFVKHLKKIYLKPDIWEAIFRDLFERGITKINFVGGEPFLYPYLEQCCRFCKELGFTVSVVSNGSLITREKLESMADCIDWLGLSIDSVSEETEIMLGRTDGRTGHLDNVRKVSAWAKELGIRTKLNTTVTHQSVHDDFRQLVKELDPDRAKFFRVLQIENMNGDDFSDVAVNDEEFAEFCEVHSGIMLSNGEKAVIEDNEDMESSYFMMDPMGRIMDNTGREMHFHDYRENIDCLGEIVSADKYESRGGRYDWSSKDSFAVYGVSRSGKDYTIEDALRMLSDEGKDLMHISHIGEVHRMLDGRSLKDMPAEEKQELMARVRASVKALNRGSLSVVDRHCCFPRTYGGRVIHSGYTDEKLPFVPVHDDVTGMDYEVVFDPRDLDRTRAVFYINTPSQTVLERFRTSDGCKRNDDITLEDVRCWQDFEIRYLSDRCREADIPFFVLSKEENAEELAELLSENMDCMKLQ